MVIFASNYDRGSERMIKRILSVFVIFFALTIVTGLVVYANPSIIDVRHNRPTGWIQGSPVTFTVYVSNETGFVWARAGVNAVPVPAVEAAGVPLGTPAGRRVFNVTIVPTAAGNVDILANTTNNTANAIVWPVQILDSGGQAATPGAVGGIQILGITETRALQPNSVQLTVVTGTLAGEVWVRLGAYPHSWYRGRLQSETPASRIWTINYTPALFVPHRVQVGSNTTYNLVGASVQYFDVGLTAPYAPIRNPVIFGRTLSTNTVNVGNSVTIRVSTNQDVYSVWVMDSDGIQTVARRIPPLIPETVRNFEVMVAPYRTGALTILAGSGVGDPHAVYITENVVVHVPPVYISQASVQRVVNSANEEATIRVVTNQNTESVWAVLPDGETIRLSLVGLPSAQGARTWEARPAGVPTPNITIRVSATMSNIPSVTQTISSWGTAIGGSQILTPTGITDFAPNTVRRGTNPLVVFYVPDNITHVRVSGTDRIPTVNALPQDHAAGGRQRWGATVGMPSDAHVTHVTLTVTTYINHLRQDTAHHEITLTN